MKNLFSFSDFLNEEIKHKWTKEECHKLALECDSRNEFRKKHNPAYQASISSNGNWLDEICSHMKEKMHKWSKEECVELAKDCNNSTDFNKKHDDAYIFARNNGFLKDLFLDFTPKHIWTKKECKKLAKKCKSSGDFQKKHIKAYHAAFVKDWLIEFFPDVKKMQRWTKEECEQIARTCSTPKEFEKTNPSAYDLSVRKNWIDEFFMTTIDDKKFNLDIDDVIEPRYVEDDDYYDI